MTTFVAADTRCVDTCPWQRDIPDTDELPLLVEPGAQLDAALVGDPVWQAGYRAGWSVGHASALAAVEVFENGGAR
jgi:hypothetical protein